MLSQPGWGSSHEGDASALLNCNAFCLPGGQKAFLVIIIISSSLVWYVLQFTAITLASSGPALKEIRCFFTINLGGKYT